MRETKEIQIDNERIFLKKDIFGYRVINPAKIDGKLNWINLIFGGKRNLAIVIGLIILALIFYVGVTELIGVYKDIAMQPCNYCNESVMNLIK